MLTRQPSAFPVTVAAESQVDRRRFLGAAAGAVVLAGAGDWLARRLMHGVPELAPIDPEALAGLGPGEVRVLPRHDGETLVVRLGDGAVAAFDRRCPHLGCPVVWSAANTRFECPCHHAAFDARSGRVLFGPPQTGLTPVTIRTT